MSQGFHDAPKRRGSAVGKIPSSGVFVLPQMTNPALHVAPGQLLGHARAVVTAELEALVERRAGKLGAEVLEEEGHAAERAVGQRARLLRRLGPGPVEELVDDGVQLRVELLDPADRLVHQLGRRNNLAPDEVRLPRCVQPCRVVAHGRTVPTPARPRSGPGSAQARAPAVASCGPAAGAVADPSGLVAPVRMAIASFTVTSPCRTPRSGGGRRVRPAASMLEDHRPLTLELVAVAPLEQRHEDGPQVGALLGEPVLTAQRALLVRPLHQDPFLDEPLEPRLQDVAGDPEVLLQLLEAPDPQEDVADDEQRPPLAHHLERRRHRAVLVGVVTLQHPPSIPDISALSIASCNFLP